MYAGIKMNGEAKGGRLNGVNFGLSSFGFLVGSGGEVVVLGSSASDDEGVGLSSALGVGGMSVAGAAFKNRIASGLTETMSPGAKRVFAFWCC
jgi:hypothetical protein